MNNDNLHNIILNGSLSDVEIYLKTKSINSINDKSLFDITPLHVAVKSDMLDKVELLIHKGADVNLANDSGWTPLFDAVIQENLTIVDLLISNGAYIDLEDNYGMSSLDHAFMLSKIDSLKCLLKNGASVKNFIFDNQSKSLIGFDGINMCLASRYIDNLMLNPWYITDEQVTLIDRYCAIIIPRIKSRLKNNRDLFNNTEILSASILSEELLSVQSKRSFQNLKIAFLATSKLLCLQDISSIEIEAIYEHNEIFLQEVESLNFMEINKLKSHLKNLITKINLDSHYNVLLRSFMDKIEECEKQIYTIEAVLLKLAYSEKSILLVPFNILKDITENYSKEPGVNYGQNLQYNIYFKDWDRIKSTLKFYDENPEFKIAGSLISKFLNEQKLFNIITSASEDIRRVLVVTMNDFVKGKNRIYSDIKRNLHKFIEKNNISKYT